MASTLKDKILLRRSETESAITDNASLVSDFLFGETVLCYEDGRERLYCKNTENEIVPIHKNADCGEIVIQEQYVDLGLPSGNLWTKCNLGATTEDEAGLYFAWGDTVGYTAEQVGNGEGLKHFSWNDYTFGTSSNLTKYNAIDNKTVLDLEDDAAHAMLGGLWRMPTYDECMELYQNTDIFLVLSDGREIEANYSAATNEDGMYKIPWTDTSFTGQTGVTISGCKFCNKSDASKYIFVPASGYASDGSVRVEGVYGRLWSSSLSSNYVFQAWYPGFGGELCGVDDFSRCYGYGIRPILPPPNTVEEYIKRGWITESTINNSVQRLNFNNRNGMNGKLTKPDDLDEYIQNGSVVTFQGCDCNKETLDWVIPLIESQTYTMGDNGNVGRNMFGVNDSDGTAFDLNITLNLPSTNYWHSIHGLFNDSGIRNITLNLIPAEGVELNGKTNITSFQECFIWNNKAETITINLNGVTLYATSVSGTFEFCSKLKQLNINGKYIFHQNIGYAFEGCRELESISLTNDENTTEIESKGWLPQTFNNCSKVKTITPIINITYPEGEEDVATVDGNTQFYKSFDGCSSLESVQLKGINLGGLNLSYCTSLSADSINYLLTNSQPILNQVTTDILLPAQTTQYITDGLIAQETIDFTKGNGFTLKVGETTL